MGAVTADRRMQCVDKRSGETATVTAVRSWWETSGAPNFTTEPGEWLAVRIPALPALAPIVA